MSSLAIRASSTHWAASQTWLISPLCQTCLIYFPSSNIAYLHVLLLFQTCLIYYSCQTWLIYFPYVRHALSTSSACVKHALSTSTSPVVKHGLPTSLVSDILIYFPCVKHGLSTVYFSCFKHALSITPSQTWLIYFSCFRHPYLLPLCQTWLIYMCTSLCQTWLTYFSCFRHPYQLLMSNMAYLLLLFQTSLSITHVNTYFPCVKHESNMPYLFFACQMCITS